jgi:DNA helicase-2/ATP-dependent DNA helicase PcrA
VNPAQSSDPERDRIVHEEQACLEHVKHHLRERARRGSERPADDYDVRMLDLRDQIASARLEDVPPLLEEMERLQRLAAHRRESTEVSIDSRSPYFGHLVLEEGERRREVLIGRGTFLDTKSGIRIVDWRDAPVSRLYYRYEEGEDYDETFGEREISGTVVVRRSVSIVDGALRRITAPQGTFVRTDGAAFRRVEGAEVRLAGGAGSAIRAEQHHRPGRLGTGQDGGDDRHLREITALIDRRQFELLTRPDSGLVVIQGGAGSGKTTIGLHRLAYLAFRDPRRFRPDRMLVIVFNEALARYVSQVLPALGIDGVAIRTYESWAQRLRHAQFPALPEAHRDDTPSVVTRLKKHPAMLSAIAAYVAGLAGAIDAELSALTAAGGESAPALAVFRASEGRPLSHRLSSVARWIAENRALSTNLRIALERTVKNGRERALDVIAAWADLLSDRSALGRYFGEFAPGEFTTRELDRVHAWCTARIHEVLAELELRREQQRDAAGERARSERRDDDGGDDGDDRDDELGRGIDGRELTERARLDAEDDTLLLRLSQLLRGPLTRSKLSKDALIYEHVLVDEAQDLSPVELAVVFDTTSTAKSVTLAGDVQQRLLMDNGFSDWKTVLGELGLSHVEVEPLRLSYRSTGPIIELARGVLGPLASPDEPVATRGGAPVELFTFGHTGDAVAFLADALRELMQIEPSASVAVVTRYPEQADLYFDGLKRGEVPFLRRIAEQDFPFRPGVDVTDVRQVKGLEFDYVVLAEVSEASYPVDDESRHLLHIAATRAAHQLWLLAAGRPSQLLPEELRSRSS